MRLADLLDPTIVPLPATAPSEDLEIVSLWRELDHTTRDLALRQLRELVRWTRSARFHLLAAEGEPE